MYRPEVLTCAPAITTTGLKAHGPGTEATGKEIAVEFEEEAMFDACPGEMFEVGDDVGDNEVKFVSIGVGACVGLLVGVKVACDIDSVTLMGQYMPKY